MGDAAHLDSRREAARFLTMTAIEVSPRTAIERLLGSALHIARFAMRGG